MLVFEVAEEENGVFVELELRVRLDEALIHFQWDLMALLLLIITLIIDINMFDEYLSRFVEVVARGLDVASRGNEADNVAILALALLPFSMAFLRFKVRKLLLISYRNRGKEYLVFKRL